MNRIFIIISMTLTMASGLYAQEAVRVTNASSKQIEDFFNSKTRVVLDANPFAGYNMVIADVMKKYWDVTPYEIITSDQFEQTRSDPNQSFIFLSKVQLGRDRQEVFYMYLNVVMGARTRDLTGLPVLLMLPLSYSEVDEDSYVDKLPLMIRFTQLHLNNLRAARNPRPLFNLKSYSDESKQLIDKTLLVLESDLSEEVNTLEKIRKEYPGTIKIVTPEEMVKAIEEKTPDTAVLHQISPAENENRGRSYCQIYGADDAKLYYFNHQDITQRRPEGMLARDFRLILGQWF